jgi:hypothetical protein
MLKVGDRVAIAIVAAKTFDRPHYKKPENVELRRQQEKRY